MTYLKYIEQVPLIRDVDSCTTAGDLDYPGTAFEVNTPDFEEILHVVVDAKGEQQVLIFPRDRPLRMPLVLLESILARAKEVVRAK